MAKQQSKLLTIYDNVVLRNKIAEALDNDTDYAEIVDMCKSYGIDVSTSSISRYAQKRKEAVLNGQDLREVLDTDTQTALTKIKKKRVDTKDESETAEPELVETKAYSTEVMLDKIMSMGYNKFMTEDVDISVKDWLAAIKLYTQINGNNNHGLTTEGLQQLKLHQQAVNTAFVHVILKYIPKEKQEEALNYFSKTEKEQYKKLDTSGQGRALLEALDIGGLKEFGE